MNIRQLYYFISVAETSSFSKAAMMHYIAQPAMSQQIAALEQEFSVKLFERTSHSVCLTPAGKVFYEEVKVILDRIENAVNKTINAARGATVSINIGFQGLHEMEILPQLITNFHFENPDIEVHISQNLVMQLENNLKDGLADMVFTLPFYSEIDHNINVLPVIKSRWCAVLNAKHPLAGHEKISRSELCDENFICIDPKLDPYVIGNMINTCQKSGFHPRVITYTKSFEETFLMIEAGLGIWLFPKCCNRDNNNLRFIELEGEAEDIDIVLLWNKNNENPAIPLFIKEVKLLMADYDLAPPEQPFDFIS